MRDESCGGVDGVEVFLGLAGRGPRGVLRDNWRSGLRVGNVNGEDLLG